MKNKRSDTGQFVSYRLRISIIKIIKEILQYYPFYFFYFRIYAKQLNKQKEIYNKQHENKQLIKTLIWWAVSDKPI